MYASYDYSTLEPNSVMHFISKANQESDVGQPVAATSIALLRTYQEKKLFSYLTLQCLAWVYLGEIRIMVSSVV